MTIWQLQCYLVHTHMLHEDMTSDYRKIGQDMIYVKKNFTNRVVNIWNSLPDYVVHADTVLRADLIHSGLIKIWYITSKPKLAEPEVEVKL